MKIAGTVLLIVGIIATIITGISAINESEVINFLGAEIALSTANWTPLIISVVILIAGLVIRWTATKR